MRHGDAASSSPSATLLALAGSVGPGHGRGAHPARPARLHGAAVRGPGGDARPGPQQARAAAPLPRGRGAQQHAQRRVRHRRLRRARPARPRPRADQRDLRRRGVRDHGLRPGRPDRGALRGPRRVAADAARPRDARRPRRPPAAAPQAEPGEEPARGHLRRRVLLPRPPRPRRHRHHERRGVGGGPGRDPGRHRVRAEAQVRRLEPPCPATTAWWRCSPTGTA